MKKINIMRYSHVVAMIAMMVSSAGCKYDEFIVTDKPFVEFDYVELFIGSDAGSHSFKQVNASPENRVYKWKSFEPEVATVTQSGLIRAISEGFATISVSSANDVTNIYVWVRPWVPVDDITLSTYNITRPWNGFKEMQKVDYVLYPSTTTQREVTWSSTDESVVSVMEHGWLAFNNKGKAYVYVSIPSGEIKRITVQIGEEVEP